MLLPVCLSKLLLFLLNVVFSYCHQSKFSLVMTAGGKLLLEMNRILRPNGYFILSSQHESVEEEEGWSSFV